MSTRSDRMLKRRWLIRLLNYQPLYKLPNILYLGGSGILIDHTTTQWSSHITYLKVDRDLDDVDAHGNHMTSGGAVVPGSTNNLTLF